MHIEVASHRTAAAHFCSAIAARLQDHAHQIASQRSMHLLNCQLQSRDHKANDARLSGPMPLYVLIPTLHSTCRDASPNLTQHPSFESCRCSEARHKQDVTLVLGACFVHMVHGAHDRAEVVQSLCTSSTQNRRLQFRLPWQRYMDQSAVVVHRTVLGPHACPLQPRTCCCRHLLMPSATRFAGCGRTQCA